MVMANIFLKEPHQKGGFVSRVNVEQAEGDEKLLGWRQNKEFMV